MDTLLEQFHPISGEEFEKLRLSISKVATLIAGADGEIHDKETEWAKKLTSIRSYSAPSVLKEFYLQVDTDFEVTLSSEISRFNSSGREKGISILQNELEELNPIIERIENEELSLAIYDSLRTFAKHVANAAGGFLKFGSISQAERELIQLNMLGPDENGGDK